MFKTVSTQLDKVKISNEISANEVGKSGTIVLKSPTKLIASVPNDLFSKKMTLGEYYKIKHLKASKTESYEEHNDDELEIHEDSIMSKPPTYETEDSDDEHLSSTRKTQLLSSSAPTYELEKFKRKLLVIFNQVHVMGHDRRVGTEKDAMALTYTFKNLGFDVKTVTDATRNDILTHLDEFAEKDFTDYGCLAVAVLTYGIGGGVLRARDLSDFTERDVINRVMNKNRTLVTKPRIVIFQASNGENNLVGIHDEEYSDAVYENSKEGKQFYTLPAESDMLIIHSSFPGKHSHRTMSGSWFIQTLCDAINSSADTEDLESIMVEVKRRVALKEYVKYNKSIGMNEKIKQMPVVTSTLIRKLYLRNYEEKLRT